MVNTIIKVLHDKDEAKRKIEQAKREGQSTRANRVVHFEMKDEYALGGSCCLET